jgi:hypothetical protein
LSDDFVLANVLNDLSFLLPHQLYHSLTHLKTTAIEIQGIKIKKRMKPGETILFFNLNSD